MKAAGCGNDLCLGQGILSFYHVLLLRLLCFPFIQLVARDQPRLRPPSGLYARRHVLRDVVT